MLGVVCVIRGRMVRGRRINLCTIWYSALGTLYVRGTAVFAHVLPIRIFC